ncbi:MAG: hypothetical protein KDJ63_02080 [Nitratireductor sp.]|nr:hypothetical protein [Nitratireductor sp.]
MRRMKNFLRNESGNFAVIFGLSLVPLAMLSAITVDYSNYKRMEGVAINAAEAAILAAAKDVTREREQDFADDQDYDLTKEQVEAKLAAKFRPYFETNLELAGYETSPDDYTLTFESKEDTGGNADKSTAKLNMEYKNSLLQLVAFGGRDSFPITTELSVNLKSEPENYAIDIVMCIDATGSMQNTLNSVTANAKSFNKDLRTHLGISSSNSSIKIRTRPIFYRDWEEGRDSATALSAYNTAYAAYLESYAAWEANNGIMTTPISNAERNDLRYEFNNSKWYYHVDSSDSWVEGTTPGSSSGGSSYWWKKGPGQSCDIWDYADGYVDGDVSGMNSWNDLKRARDGISWGNLRNLINYNYFWNFGQFKTWVGDCEAASGTNGTHKRVTYNGENFYFENNNQLESWMDTLSTTGATPAPTPPSKPAGILGINDYGSFIDLDPNQGTGATADANSTKLKSFLGSEYATGGHDLPEGAGACLNEAIRSDWYDTQSDESREFFKVPESHKVISAYDKIPAQAYTKVTQVPVIVFWSDAAVNSLQLSRDYLSASTPPTYEAFENLWDNKTKIDQDTKLMIRFGPEYSSGWNTIKDWSNYYYGGSLQTGNDSAAEKIAEKIKDRMKDILYVAK